MSVLDGANGDAAVGDDGAAVGPALNSNRQSQSPAGTSPSAMELTHPDLQLVDGVYRTPPRRIGLLARWFPSLMFYIRFMWVIWSGSWLAKHGRYSNAGWARSSLGVMRALEAVGVKIEVRGLEHIARLDGPAVIAGNHMSSLETGALPVLIVPYRDVTFIVKRSLIDYPVFKHMMRFCQPIAVSQTNPREDLKITLVEGEERLRRGVSVVVFPEGSRRKTFEPARFNSIAVKLAGRAGTPVVPLALRTDAWLLGKRVPDLGRIDPSRPVRLEFGPPVAVTGRGGDANQAVIEFISGRLAAWDAEDRQHGQA